MRPYMTIGGVPSTDFDFYLADTNLYAPAIRQYEDVVVPGRSGTLTMDQGRYANTPRTFKLYTRKIKKLKYFEAFLLGIVGYVRIEHTLEPDTYIMGKITDVQIVAQGTRTGAIELSLDCKPQHYFKAGEQVITMTSSGTLHAPTAYPAKPLIRVYGTGAFQVGAVTVTISSNPTYIDLDSELMDAYCGSVNCNSLVSLSGYDYPELSGDTTITLGVGITKLEITPRWWTTVGGGA